MRQEEQRGRRRQRREEEGLLTGSRKEVAKGNRTPPSMLVMSMVRPDSLAKSGMM